jgi:hypothetical protein
LELERRRREQRLGAANRGRELEASRQKTLMGGCSEETVAGEAEMPELARSFSTDAGIARERARERAAGGLGRRIAVGSSGRRR